MDEILDGGSAAPATPDVPTCGDQLGVQPDNWIYICSEPASHDGPHFDSRRPMSWTHLPDHSGVAGERSDSQIASTPSGTPVPAPTPTDPSAALTTGCVVVPDEAVEAARTTLAESGLLAGSIWADEDGAVSGVARAIVHRVGPLIAAQALRDAVGVLEMEIGKAPGLWGPQAVLAGVGDALDWFRKRADELERGGNRPLEWYAPHDHGDAVGSHQHFPANSGHGSHEGVQLVAYRPERGGDQPKPDRGTVTADDHAIVSRATGGRVRSAERVPEYEDDEPTQDDLNALIELIAGRVDQAQRMGAVLIAGTLLDAGYRKVERGGDHG